MINDYTDVRPGSGYFEAMSSTAVDTAFTEPEGDFCFLDASSQVPNLRPGEIFRSLWAAVKYPRSEIVTDITLSGLVGTYAHHWGQWEGIPDIVNQWWDFYYPLKGRLSMLSGLPIYAATFKNGDIVSQRLAAIQQVARMLHGYAGFDADEVMSRIKINEFLGSAWSYGVTLSQVASLTPQGKAIGNWTCPCCGYRRSLRQSDSGYLITNAKGSICESECWAHHRVLKRIQSDPGLSVFTLTTLTGIEWNVDFAIHVSGLASGLCTPILLRDYSDPRGTVSRQFDSHRDRIRLSTRHYLKSSSDHEEMSLERLRAMCQREPSKVVECMHTYPLISEGKCLTIYG